MRLSRQIGLATSLSSFKPSFHRFHLQQWLQCFSGSFQVPAQCRGCIFNCMPRSPFPLPADQLFCLQARKSGDMQSVASLSYSQLNSCYHKGSEMQLRAFASRGKKLWWPRKRQLHVRTSHQYYVTDKPPHCHWQDITVKCRSGKRCLNITRKSHDLHIKTHTSSGSSILFLGYLCPFPLPQLFEKGL